MGKLSRNKGKRGERATATELRKALPDIADTIRRGWQSRDGDDDPDVIVPGYWLEVKTGAKPNMRAALAQAISDSDGRGTPVAVVRDNRREPVAVMRWKDLLAMIAQLRAAGEAMRGRE